MDYGRSLSRPLIACAIAAVLAFAIHGAATGAGAGWAPATLLSLHADRAALRSAGGDSMTAEVTPATILLFGGAPTNSLSSFSSGETVMVRLRAPTKPGAAPRLTMLADLRTAEAIALYRKRPLAGKLASAQPGWLIVRTADAGLVPVELSGSTLYRRRGIASQACPFAVGDSVVVASRASASGALTARTVSDDSGGVALPLLPASIVRGTVVTVDPAAHTVEIVTNEAAKVRLSVPLGVATVRVEREKASLAAVQPGMSVTARLAGGRDGAGYVVKSLSASADAPAIARP